MKGTDVGTVATALDVIEALLCLVIDTHGDDSGGAISGTDGEPVGIGLRVTAVPSDTRLGCLFARGERGETEVVGTDSVGEGCRVSTDYSQTVNGVYRDGGKRLRLREGRPETNTASDGGGEEEDQGGDDVLHISTIPQSPALLNHLGKFSRTPI